MLKKVFFHLLGVEDAHLEEVVGTLVNCGVVGVVFAVSLQMHHHGNHVYRLLVQVVVGNALRR